MNKFTDKTEFPLPVNAGSAYSTDVVRTCPKCGAVGITEWHFGPDAFGLSGEVVPQICPQCDEVLPQTCHGLVRPKREPLPQRGFWQFWGLNWCY